jgi:outer membrane protein OmpA-like peptidoglycan-associated protein
MWEAPGEEMHDLRLYGIERGYVAPLTACYHFLGETIEDGKRLAKLSMNTVVHTKTPESYLGSDPRQPVRLMGTTMSTFYWDLDENCPYRHEEKFHFLLTTRGGSVLEFVGDAVGSLKKLRRVSTRERDGIAEEIRKGLDREKVPAEVTTDERGVHIDVGEVFFEHDSAAITADAEKKIGRIADILKGYGDFEVVVEGHTDSTGGDEYNERLSEERSRSVAERLLRGGRVEKRKLSYRGLGESYPKASNDTAEGRARNRRVEIILLTR